MAGTRTENAKRNIFFALLQNIVGIVLPFAVRTAFIYLLGELYLGLNTLFTSVLEILSLAELGFGSAMVFSMYDPIAREDTPAVCALLNLYRKIYRVLGCCVLGVGIIAMPFLRFFIRGAVPPGVNMYVLYLVSLGNTVIGYFMFGYKEALLSANQRSDVISRIGMVQRLLQCLSQIVVLLLLRSYYAYCLLAPVFTVVQNLMTKRATDRMYPQYRCHGQVPQSQMADIKKRVAGLFIYKVCGVFRNSFDSIILSAFMGLAVLAKYNNYYFILSSVTGFVAVIQGSITASVGNSIALESVEKNHGDFMKFQMLFMWMSGVCTVCFFCLYQPFILLWAGSAWLFEVPVMTIFCVYFFTLRLGDTCYTYRMAAGLFWEDRYRPIVEAVVNLTLNIILVRTIGVTGVLLSTVLCLVFINALWGSYVLYRYYFKAYSVREYLLRLVFFALCTAAACAASAWICRALPVAGRDLVSIAAFCGRGIVSVAVPCVLFAVVFRILPEYGDAFAFLRNVLKR